MRLRIRDFWWACAAPVLGKSAGSSLVGRPNANSGPVRLVGRRALTHDNISGEA